MSLSSTQINQTKTIPNPSRTTTHDNATNQNQPTRKPQHNTSTHKTAKHDQPTNGPTSHGDATSQSSLYPSELPFSRHAMLPLSSKDPAQSSSHAPRPDAPPWRSPSATSFGTSSACSSSQRRRNLLQLAPMARIPADKLAMLGGMISDFLRVPSDMHLHPPATMACKVCFTLVRKTCEENGVNCRCGVNDLRSRP